MQRAALISTEPQRNPTRQGRFSIRFHQALPEPMMKLNGCLLGLFALFCFLF